MRWTSKAGPRPLGRPVTAGLIPWREEPKRPASGQVAATCSIREMSLDHLRKLKTSTKHKPPTSQGDATRSAPLGCSSCPSSVRVAQDHDLCKLRVVVHGHRLPSVPSAVACGRLLEGSQPHDGARTGPGPGRSTNATSIEATVCLKVKRPAPVHLPKTPGKPKAGPRGDTQRHRALPHGSAL